MGIETVPQVIGGGCGCVDRQTVCIRYRRRIQCGRALHGESCGSGIKINPSTTSF